MIFLPLHLPSPQVNKDIQEKGPITICRTVILMRKHWMLCLLFVWYQRGRWRSASRSSGQCIGRQIMSSKKAGTSACCSTNKKSPKKDSVDDVTNVIWIPWLLLLQTTFASTFSLSKHREKGGVKDIVHIQLQTVILPISYIWIAKVLPGGMNFATCKAAQKVSLRRATFQHWCKVIGAKTMQALSHMRKWQSGRSNH